jgi:hypothetical protein
MEREKREIKNGAVRGGEKVANVPVHLKVLWRHFSSKLAPFSLLPPPQTGIYSPGGHRWGRYMNSR